jgi:hypothetical protein
MQVTNTVTSLLRSEIHKLKFYNIGFRWNSETLVKIWICNNEVEFSWGLKFQIWSQILFIFAWRNGMSNSLGPNLRHRRVQVSGKERLKVDVNVLFQQVKVGWGTYNLNCCHYQHLWRLHIRVLFPQLISDIKTQMVKFLVHLMNIKWYLRSVIAPSIHWSILIAICLAGKAGKENDMSIAPMH